MKILILLLLPALCLAQSPSPAPDTSARFGRLKGERIVGCVLEEAPYIVQNHNRQDGYDGVAFEYLRRLKENLKFSLTLKPWNDTWSKFIDHMSECKPRAPESNPNKCTCDIGIGSFTMTNARAEVIEFIWPLGNEAHRMVSRTADLRSDDSQNTWFVFNTFSLQVWIIIAFGMGMHALGSLAFGPFQPPERDLPRNATHRRRRGIMWRIKKFPAAILFAYAHLLGHPFGEERQGSPSFHRTAWLMLGITAGLFLLTIYEASLTVLLFESTKESPFKTLDSIKGCAVDPSRVAMIKGGASQAFWNSAVNTTGGRKTCPQWRKVGTTVENLEEGFEAVRAGKVDFFYSLQGSIVIRAQRNCDVFAPVGEPFFSTSVGFVMPKKIKPLQNIFDELSRETRILREQDGFESVTKIVARSSCEDELDAHITAGKLWAFFIMYCICWAGLLLYRVLLLWYRKRNGKEKGEVSTPTKGDIVLMDMHSDPTRGMPGMAGKKKCDDCDPFDEQSSSIGYSIPDGYPLQSTQGKVTPLSSGRQTPAPRRNSSPLRQEALADGRQSVSNRRDEDESNPQTSDGYPLETYHSRRVDDRGANP